VKANWLSTGFILAYLLPMVLAQNAKHSELAFTPPMGWNSWDSYALTVRESEIRSNAEWMAANLRSFGWQYIVVDEGWYLQNPEQAGKVPPEFTLDANGRYGPAPNRFPSAQGNSGFKPLADYVHSLGLKFGIHIIRGIPREAVSKNLLIAGSEFHARDAVNQNDLCYWQDKNVGDKPGQKIYWNSDNYGVQGNEAGQAYYNSALKLYAYWGVDFIKVDCISNPYQAREIKMIRRAIENSGRPIVLSLSPGPTPLDEADDVRKYAQMWRISNDVTDYWNGRGITPGIKDLFPVAAAWARHAEAGGWPDADMLPIGFLGPRNDQPRETRLTHDEVKTLLTLWSMLRSPLMIGGDLPSMDPWTTALLTNRDVLAVDQRSTAGHQVISNGDTVVWTARGQKKDESYVAIFNIGDRKQTLTLTWRDIQLPDRRYEVTDLWNHASHREGNSLNVTLDPHASVIYRVRK
jgi:alpha-galactosidase